MKLDFGSGHNPLLGFKTCDITEGADYRFNSVLYEIPLPDNSVSELHYRNTLHHIRCLDLLAAEFYRIMMPGAKLVIIEVTRKAYQINKFLDSLWYRGIIPRPEIWCSEEYRDYIKIFKEWFKFNQYETKNEKEIVVFIKEDSQNLIDLWA